MTTEEGLLVAGCIVGAGALWYFSRKRKLGYGVVTAPVGLAGTGGPLVSAPAPIMGGFLGAPQMGDVTPSMVGIDPTRVITDAPTRAVADALTRAIANAQASPSPGPSLTALQTVSAKSPFMGSTPSVQSSVSSLSKLSLLR